MTNEKDKKLLFDIFLSFCRLKYYIEDTTASKLKKDVKTRDAIGYNLRIMGELVDKLSSDFREKHYRIAWSLLVLFRIPFFYAESEIWSILKDEDNGILNDFDKLAEIYKVEYPDEWKEYMNHARENDLSLSTNYKFPIHSKSSIWTVKKK